MSKLDDKKVAAIKGPEAGKSVMRVRDGLADGLWLRVTKHTNKQGVEAVSKSWEFYFTLNGKTSCTGLGRWVPTPPHGEPKLQRGLSVKEARKRAAELLEMVEAGQNPVAVNRAKKAEPDAPKVVTFADALDEYMNSPIIKKFRSEKYRKQWRASLDLHVIPTLGDKDVGGITIDDVKSVLKPVWEATTDTARRLRGRMERVFAAAIDEGHRSADNPASIKVLENWISRQGTAEKSNYPAIQQSDLQSWFSDLLKRQGMSARALEFATLCASRSGEVRGATWDEIDLQAKLWTIPAARMKMKKGHTIPLPDAAVALLKALPREDGTSLVFPAPRGGEMSDMTISAVAKKIHEAKAKKDGRGYVDPRVLVASEDPNQAPQPRPAVPHGLRSTFKDWATERGYDNILSELALAHNVGNEVERAYRRTDLVEQRRAMMNAYAAFCRGEAVADNVVVPLRGAV